MAKSKQKEAKAAAVVARLEAIHEGRELLIPMLDEDKLDMLILALGIGRVTPADEVTRDDWAPE